MLSLQVSKRVRDTYTAFAIFKNHRQAIEAFDNLEGDLEKVRSVSFNRSEGFMTKTP